MKTEIIRLWKNPGITSDIVRYVPEEGDDAAKPALLIIPGGGYGIIADDHEGHQIADKFSALGFRPFILHYRILEQCSPENTFSDALRAIKMIRANAKTWNIMADNVAVLGFSAGGHLAGATATFYDKIDANDGDTADGMSARPDAAILCYAVITLEESTHGGTAQNILRTRGMDKAPYYSVNKQITKDTPPTFLWHTATDQCVPVKNSIMYLEAMRQIAPDTPCTLHIFPEGPHGIGLAPDHPDAAHWPELAAEFLKLRANFRL